MVLIEDAKAVVSTRIFPGFFQGHAMEDSCAYFSAALNGTYNQWGQLKLEVPQKSQETDHSRCLG